MSSDWIESDGEAPPPPPIPGPAYASVPGPAIFVENQSPFERIPADYDGEVSTKSYEHSNLVNP